MNWKTIGINIKKYRKKLNLTQKQLAERIYKTESSIRKYEKGVVDIPIIVLRQLSDILNISIFDLIGIDREVALSYFDINHFADYMNDESRAKERKILTMILLDEGYTVPIPSSEFTSRIVKNEMTQEDLLVDDYRKLNSDGKAEARKRIAELTEIKRYIQEELPFDND